MVQINNSTQPVSYKELEITLNAGEQYPFQQPFNTFNLLESNATDDSKVFFRFGGLSHETNLSAGLGVTFPDVYACVSIRNETSAQIKLRVAFIIGSVSDNRLTVSGNVNTVAQPLTTSSVSLETFDSNGEISVDSSSYRRVVLQNMSSTNSAFVFNNNTFEILPNGTFDLNYAGQFTVYGTAGQTLSVGLFE